MDLAVSLRVVVLDTALRLGVKEVASAVGGAGGFPAAKERPVSRPSVVPAHSATPAEETAGNQEAGHSGPCEGIGFDSQLRGVTAASEGIASFDSPCPVTVSGVTSGRLEVDLRHQCCCKSLEKKGNARGEAGKVSAESTTKCEQAGEKGNYGEKESDDVECEHKSGHIVVVMRPGKLLDLH